MNWKNYLCKSHIYKYCRTLGLGRINIFIVVFMLTLKLQNNKLFINHKIIHKCLPSSTRLHPYYWLLVYACDVWKISEFTLHPAKKRQPWWSVDRLNMWGWRSFNSPCFPVSRPLCKYTLFPFYIFFCWRLLFELKPVELAAGYAFIIL